LSIFRPRSPLVQVLEQVAIYENTKEVASAQVKEAVRQDALSSIMEIAGQEMKKIQTFRQPAALKKAEVRTGGKTRG
jgi:hypothetical protein